MGLLAPSGVQNVPLRGGLFGVRHEEDRQAGGSEKTPDREGAPREACEPVNRIVGSTTAEVDDKEASLIRKNGGSEEKGCRLLCSFCTDHLSRISCRERADSSCTSGPCFNVRTTCAACATCWDGMVLRGQTQRYVHYRVVVATLLVVRLCSQDDFH